MYKPYFESDDLSDACWSGWTAIGLKTKNGKKVPNCVKKEDYRMEHTAPDKDSGDPLHDLSNVYPEDLYSSNGARYYGHGNSYDGLTVSLIQQYKGKPNAMVTIYRAVPDFNKETKKKIKALTDILKYKAKFPFFPKNKIVDELEDKYPIEKYSYDEQQKLIYQDIEKQLEELKKNLSKKVEINPGDWVGITKQYAIDHGKSHVDDYMIISKKVKAKDVYTNGDSIHEWGYSP